MSQSIAIYFEGGAKGDRKKLDAMRIGMSAFIGKAIGDVRGRARFRAVPCAGRQQAYAAFCDAVRNEPESLNILLVDSEEWVALIADDPRPWAHLAARKDDPMRQPKGVTQEQCHLMVTTMEAWFIADPDNLAKHYLKSFIRSKLPKPEQAERIARDKSLAVLKAAIDRGPKKVFHKIDDGARLLAVIDPRVVRGRCPWCNRFLEYLGACLGIPA